MFKQILTIIFLSLPLYPSNDNFQTLPGPDGLKYPDFRFAGVPGGIPNLKGTVDITEFGAKPNDDLDDSEAIQKAIDSTGQNGGGVILLGEGTWTLDRPLVIESDKVVLRGAGKQKTYIQSRFMDFTKYQILVSGQQHDSTLQAGSTVEAYFDPAGMLRAKLEVDGLEISKRGTDRGRNIEYWIQTTSGKIREVLLKAGKKIEGIHELKVTVTWAPNFKQSVMGSEAGGKWITDEKGLRKWQEDPDPDDAVTKSLTCPLSLEGTEKYDLWRPTVSPPGMINFRGLKKLEAWNLEETLKIGDLQFHLTGAKEKIKIGDLIEFYSPVTERYKKEILSTVPAGWGGLRWQAVVTFIENDEVFFNQPNRMEFPLEDKPNVRIIKPLTGCGAEGFTFQQKVPRLVHSLQFNNAYGSWIQNVAVDKTGRFPYNFDGAKFCEIRDMEATDAWFGVRDNMGGGTAYVSFDSVWDCLLDGFIARGLRHAPNLQNASSGNVMRRMDTVGSDIQWHAFTTCENLIENCKTEAFLEKGGCYGYGCYASGSDSIVHGPQLHGNVVYGCDIASSETSFVHRGGPTARGWIVAYNRFRVRDQGFALQVQLGLPDFTFIGNICSTPNPVAILGVASYRTPGAELKYYNPEGAAIFSSEGDMDGLRKPIYEPLLITGLKVINNQFYGFKSLFTGKGKMEEERGNQLKDLQTGVEPKLPIAPTPSLFAWQKEKYPLPVYTFPIHPKARIK